MTAVLNSESGTHSSAQADAMLQFDIGQQKGENDARGTTLLSLVGSSSRVQTHQHMFMELDACFMVSSSIFKKLKS